MKFRNAILVILLSFALIANAQHTVTLSMSDTSCTSSNQCTAQFYRASGACPSSGLGTLTYTELAPAVTGTSTTSTTSWSYTDSTVADNQTYCYYATATFTAGGAPSAASNTFQLVIPITPPSAPTLSGVVN